MSIKIKEDELLASQLWANFYKAFTHCTLSQVNEYLSAHGGYYTVPSRGPAVLTFKTEADYSMFVLRWS